MPTMEDMWKKYRSEREKNSHNDAFKGKKPNQKLKPYIVLQDLQRYSDNNHPLSATDIITYLSDIGIDAERRSIYRDIDEINKVSLMLEEE